MSVHNIDLTTVFGIWEYLAQSYNNADCVNPDRRFKFVDDLSTLEKINLLIIGLASFNSKESVPSDMPEHNQYIPGENLKSQEYLTKIKQWTDNQKMILNENKTKLIIFNFSEKYQFGTRLELNGQNSDVYKKLNFLVPSLQMI